MTLKEKICKEIYCKDLHENEIWKHINIRRFVGHLNVQEQDQFEQVIDEMVNEGYVERFMQGKTGAYHIRVLKKIN